MSTKPTQGRQLNARERGLLAKAPMAMPADAVVGDGTQPIAARLVLGHPHPATGERLSRTTHGDDFFTIDEIVKAEPEEWQAAMRALRLWHWRHALAASRRREDWRTTPATKAQARQAWSFHMGAVQALNGLFPSGDTAEQDDKPDAQFAPLTHLRIPT